MYKQVVSILFLNVRDSKALWNHQTLLQNKTIDEFNCFANVRGKKNKILDNNQTA